MKIMCEYHWLYTCDGVQALLFDMLYLLSIDDWWLVTKTRWCHKINEISKYLEAKLFYEIPCQFNGNSNLGIISRLNKCYCKLSDNAKVFTDIPKKEKVISRLLSFYQVRVVHSHTGGMK